MEKFAKNKTLLSFRITSSIEPRPFLLLWCSDGKRFSFTAAVSEIKLGAHVPLSSWWSVSTQILHHKNNTFVSTVNVTGFFAINFMKTSVTPLRTFVKEPLEACVWMCFSVEQGTLSGKPHLRVTDPDCG